MYLSCCAQQYFNFDTCLRNHNVSLTLWRYGIAFLNDACCIFFVSFCSKFSDHEMLRRASTEAMCNLLPHQKMIDHLKNADTLKLWAAFSQLGTEDPPTAAAALGCLAMAFRDPEVIYITVVCLSSNFLFPVVSYSSVFLFQGFLFPLVSFFGNFFFQ